MRLLTVSTGFILPLLIASTALAFLADRARVSGGEPYSLTSKTPQGVTNSNAPTFAFTDNTPVQNRRFVALLSFRDNDVAGVVTWGTVTIGGVTATQIVEDQKNTSGRTYGCAVYAAAVPTGTTVNVAVSATFAGTMDGWYSGLLRVPSIDLTAVATGTGGDSVSITPTAATRFVAVAGGDFSGMAEGDTMNAGNGSRTTIFSGVSGILAYAESPGAGATVYDFSADTDTLCAAAFR